MAHKLKSRLDKIEAALNPPVPPKLIWCEIEPDVLEPNAIYVRWRTAEEEDAARAYARHALPEQGNATRECD